MRSSSTLTAPAAAPTAPRRESLPLVLLLVLGLLSAIAPLATDLYLPSFVQIAGDLDTSSVAVQLTLTAFLAGLTVGQLVFGPVSDRWGRRGPLLVGSVVFLLASIATVLAPTIGVLIAARAVQGLAGAAGTVIARAIISDLAAGPPAARAFSLMMIVGGVAPVVAPVLGGALTDVIGWRGLLAIVMVLAAVMLVAVLLVVKESLSTSRWSELRATRDQAAGLGALLRSRAYLGHTITFGFAFAAMMAYISASPFLYQEMMGFGSLGYGLAFGVNALALMIVSGVSASLTSTVPVARLLRLGLAGASIAVALGLVLSLSGAPVITMTVPIFLTVASMGLIFGNATALALGAVPGSTGLASALLGALQFGLAAVVSPLVGLGDGTSALPMALVMAVCVTVALAGQAIARRARATTTPMP